MKKVTISIVVLLFITINMVSCTNDTTEKTEHLYENGYIDKDKVEPVDP